MSARRVAIAGGSGQLGTALRDVLRDRDVFAPAHAEPAQLFGRDMVAETWERTLRG